jgi:ABC-2 type transport system ATP-binding protein
VFISSHLLSEIEMMCDRVAIISKGRVISVGLVEELMEQFADQVEWTIPTVYLQKAIRVLRGLPCVSEAWQAGEERVKCRMNTERVSEANRALVEEGVPVQGIATKTVTLEDLFLSVTEGGNQDGARHAGTGAK